jgi:hypothetical protein
MDPVAAVHRGIIAHTAVAAEAMENMATVAG